MLSLYDIPVYYIGFTKKPDLEKMFRSVGFKQVTHFKAIDAREMEPDSLLKKKIIGIAGYNDLVHKRKDNTGLPSTGAVGCSLSHIELWKKCANQFDAIVIAEDDVKLEKIKKTDENNILDALREPNGVFISTTSEVKKGKFFFGTYLCFVNKGAAIALLKNSLPIDIQVDAYISHMNNTNRINATGYKVATHTYNRFSTVQDLCVKCWLPNNLTSYIAALLALLAIVIVLVYSVRFLYRCQKSKIS